MKTSEFNGTIRFLADTTLRTFYVRPSRSEGFMAWEVEGEVTFPCGTELEVYFRGDPLSFEGTRRFGGEALRERLDVDSLVSALSSGAAEIATSYFFSDSDLHESAIEILDRCKIGGEVLTGAKVVWVDGNFFAFLREGVVHIFDNNYCFGFDPVEYGTMEEFLSGPGVDLDEFRGHVHFLEKTELPVFYTSPSGDDSDSEIKVFEPGDKLWVWPEYPYRLGCDIWGYEDERLERSALLLALIDKKVELIPC